MFIRAICFLFLLQLRWPKNKRIYNVLTDFIFSFVTGWCELQDSQLSYLGDMQRESLQCLVFYRQKSLARLVSL